jgi:BASS family bile acid:Na+ symporter
MKRLAAVSRLVHHYFLWLLLASYALAVAWPAPGLAIRNISFGEVAVFGAKTKVSLPVVMLAFLLFNAGWGIRTGGLKNLLRQPLPLVAGLAGNLLVPILYIFAVSQTMQLWHNSREVQNILVGLALVASMPIAGSSTAWSQNANGDLALSLGLVLFSTFLSPLTTPVGLHAVGLMTTGDFSKELHALANGGTDGFLAISVIVPSLLGIAARSAAGEARTAAAGPILKLLNSLDLLLLNYSNAAVSLPKTIPNAPWDFLAVTLAIVAILCAVSFAAGWLIARPLKVDVSQQVSLMFGLGMNNNGTGLVLASLSMANHPRVLLPIVFYNLVQHLMAGCVDGMLRWRQPAKCS